MNDTPDPALALSLQATTSAPPLAEWERQFDAASAARLVDGAVAALRERRWRASDLEGAIERWERRLTAAQRDRLWATILRDPELAELAATIGG